MNQGKLLVLLAVVIIFGCTMGPVTAGERFVSGGPNLTAAIVGPNDFSPGDEVTLPVAIQNSGVLQYVFTYPNQLTAADLPNTAKLMRVTLGAGEAPVIIKSDPQLVGDLKGGNNVVVGFKVKFPADAGQDTYILPLTVQYTYLDHADQYGTDALQYFYKDKVVTLGVPVRIRPEVILEIQSVTAEHVNAGNEGYLDISLKNAGNEDGREAIAKLVQSGNSPLVPVAASVYIGDFPKQAIIPLKYKIQVSKDAENSTYPVNLTVTYKDRDGDILTSDPVSIGVPVGGKIDFSVVSPPAEFNPGTKKTLVVTYKNTGSATAYSAEARIITVDPFTTTDDTSYLGDMQPGDEKTARFEVTADAGATIKEYAPDSEIKYRDALNNDQVSDRIKVPVKVVPLSGIMLLVGTPYGILLIALVIIICVYFGYVRRRKMSK